MEIEEAIAQLEDGIRKLKTAYDVFFAGGCIRPPVELRAQVDRLIRQFSNAPTARYSDRFHFNTVVGRYNSYVERWNRQLRSLEEGGGGGEALPAPSAPKLSITPTRSADPVPKVLHAALISDPAAETERLHRLFELYVAARSEREATPPKLSLDSFVRQITRQVQSLKTSRGCEAIEFVLTSNDSLVSLKARPMTGTAVVTPAAGTASAAAPAGAREEARTATIKRASKKKAKGATR